MKVKLTNPDLAAGMIDPHTKRRPFIDPETGEVLPSVDVPDTNFWVRRVRAGELARVDDEPAAPATPTGLEPVMPLTTRTTR